MFSANTLPDEASSRLQRRSFLLLGALALVYAFLAGLATAGDPDLGWQLATGRWIVQHHQLFSTDVFSYTKSGTPWIYPVGSSLILYAIYHLGGFAAFSWLSALACLSTVALLLRRGSAFSAAIAILAVPFIAFRAVPRAELFSIVLFAAFLSVLWENYQTGRAPLFLLPALMVFWVNLHLGFFAGFGLMVAFGGIDILELLFSDSRALALRRLKREIPWFLATAAASLVNPWGWRFYPALVEHLHILHTASINEWASLQWNWVGLGSFSPRNTSDLFLVLVAVTALAIIVAFLQVKLGPAILMVAALFEASRHVRMVAQAGCIAAIVGGAVLSSAVPWIRSRIPNRRIRTAIAVAAAGGIVALGVVRTTDLVTNYHYLAERNLSTFGIGLSPWLPQRAAEFIQKEKLPAEVLNTFNEGGYLIWKLGPEYRDYIDGRVIPFGLAFAQHGGQLLVTPLDSQLWEQEADRYGINTILFPLTLDEISLDRLKQDCSSKNWRPVYLDEISIVLVRRKPETEDLIKRLEINCATVSIPHEVLPRSASAFNQWIQAARVLSAIGRNSEALSAASNALAIFPDSAHAHWYRGQIFYAMQRHSEAETDWETALALAPREVTPWGSLTDFQVAVWNALGELYQRQERTNDAIAAFQAVERLSSDPSTRLQAMVGLAALYLKSGEYSQAEQQLRQALSLSPNESQLWASLADLYEQRNRLPEAIQAMQAATRLSSDPSTKAEQLMKLARLYFVAKQPQEALKTLDAAASTAPPELTAARGANSFSFKVALGRAAVWRSMGNLDKAILFEEEAVQLNPDAPDAWLHLATLYHREGRLADERRAQKRGEALRATASKF